jgi:hypothetical protein
MNAGEESSARNELLETDAELQTPTTAASAHSDNSGPCRWIVSFIRC